MKSVASDTGLGEKAHNTLPLAIIAQEASGAPSEFGTVGPAAQVPGLEVPDGV